MTDQQWQTWAAGMPADDRGIYDQPLVVEIFGSVFAYVNTDGTLDRIAFSPAGSNAGHFGPPAQVWMGDETYDVDFDGPFWMAVQDHLGGNSATPIIHWEE